MKIAQVQNGYIPIPRNGWGATELIIWEYKLGLEKLGHKVDVLYLNEVNKSYDLVHIHVANLAIECANRGIPYVFSFHDHHAYHFGKDSSVYKENLEAIKRSVFSICHAEYLIDYFETDKLFFLSHGVNTSFFTPKQKEKEIKLLCLASNGLGGNSGFDRKGFRYAIEAAKELDLPITVAGTKYNLEFFELNPDLKNYNKLTIITDNPNDEKIKELYQNHSIFIHASMLEAGHPNLTLLESLSCGLPIVGTYDGHQKLNGLYKLTSISTEEVKKGILHVLNNLDDYVKKTQEDKINFDWSIIVSRLDRMYKSINLIKKNYDSLETKKLYIDSYSFKNSSNTDLKNYEKNPIKINYHFVSNPFFEILGDNDKIYTVSFVDDKGIEQFKQSIKCNHWVKLNRQYYTKWKINLYESDNLIFSETLNYKNKKVFISFDSSSLGDNIAWIPYVEEFRKKHECKVICSTFKNDLFIKSYPEITFVPPGTIVPDINGMYTIGWFYNIDKEPTLPNTIPLQKACSNILGLEFNEIKPNIDFNPQENRFKEKYITIATSSTAQLKYWNYPNGWQILCDKLVEMGYRIIHVSKENCNLNNVTELKDKSLYNTMNTIYHSEFFIGLSSGLSWLSWALNKKVVMISNFTEPDHEFTSNCYRVINHNVCNSCWNNPMFKFDKGDWNWCPEFKGTARQFECHTSITPEMVLNKINELINEN